MPRPPEDRPSASGPAAARAASSETHYCVWGGWNPVVPVDVCIPGCRPRRSTVSLLRSAGSNRSSGAPSQARHHKEARQDVIPVRRKSPSPACRAGTRGAAHSGFSGTIMVAVLGFLSSGRKRPSPADEALSRRRGDLHLTEISERLNDIVEGGDRNAGATTRCLLSTEPKIRAEDRLCRGGRSS